MPFFGLVWVATWIGWFPTAPLLPPLPPSPQLVQASWQSAPPTRRLPNLTARPLWVSIRQALHSLWQPPVPVDQTAPPPLERSSRRRPLPRVTIARATQPPDPWVPACHSPRSPLTRFQVHVGGKLIAETEQAATAERIRQRLMRLVNRRDRSFRPDRLRLVQQHGHPVALYGSEPLFAIEPAIAQARGCQPEQLAIAGVNQLRQALGLPPLPLSTAQQALYQLQPSPTRLYGTASWYGEDFHGLETATGERFDQMHFTAAHPDLPFDTYLQVTNLQNGKAVIVRINDRGPYIDDRMLDLSYAAARAINGDEVGLIPIEATIMTPAAPPKPDQRLARRPLDGSR